MAKKKKQEITPTEDVAIEYTMWTPSVDTVTVNIINKSTNALPTYSKDGDACVDLRASFDNGWDDTNSCGAAYDSERECLILFSGGRALIGTGLYVSFPDGYKLEIIPRSGLAIKHGISVLNTPGTVDANYRGEICIELVNFSDEPFEIKHGERIAQACLIPVPKIQWNVVSELDETERGAAGFNSTGVK